MDKSQRIFNFALVHLFVVFSIFSISIATLFILLRRALGLPIQGHFCIYTGNYEENNEYPNTQAAQACNQLFVFMCFFFSHFQYLRQPSSEGPHISWLSQPSQIVRPTKFKLYCNPSVSCASAQNTADAERKQ